MPSDLVVNVRQVSSYPAQTSVLPTDNILLQRGGLGGPYLSASAAALVGTALGGTNTQPFAIGVPVPANSITQAFATWVTTAGVFFNAYEAQNGGLYAWNSGPVGIFDTTPGTGQFNWQVSAASAQQPIAPLTQIMTLSLAGELSLQRGTLTVARDPSAALEVATMGYVGANTVGSFNGRNGLVTLNQSDIYQALCLDSSIATQNWVCDQLKAAFQAMLQGTVVRWNGRMGDVYLTLSDITCVFFQPGQIPITQTPPATSNDYSIANTAWVTNYVAETLTGGSGLGLATEAWVQANTVASFNGRIGAVSLTTADGTNAGLAPIQSPQLQGVPTAPTAAVGNASSQIATTAFVWSAVQESTTGVVSFNGRTGVITLDATDINNAGGALLNSPALTGVPTAPTASTGTTTTQLATCAFVLNEVQAIGAGVTSFNTRSGNVTLVLTDIESAGGAPIASPAFSGTPTVPTPASPVAATTSIANTNWVVQYNALNTVASFNGRIGAVTLNANDVTAVGALVNPSVVLTGNPVAPTAAPTTNTTQIATCAFVQQAISNISGVTVSPTPPLNPYLGQAWFNTTAGVQSLQIYTGAAFVPATNLTGYLPLTGGVLSGNLGVAGMAVPSPLTNGGMAVTNIILPVTSGASPANVMFNCYGTAGDVTALAAGTAAWMSVSQTSFNIVVANAPTAGGEVSTTQRYSYAFRGTDGTLIGPLAYTPAPTNATPLASLPGILLPVAGTPPAAASGNIGFNTQWIGSGWANVVAGPACTIGLGVGGNPGLYLTCYASAAAGGPLGASAGFFFGTNGNFLCNNGGVTAQSATFTSGTGVQIANGNVAANSGTITCSAFSASGVANAASGTIGGVVFNGNQNAWPQGNNVSSCGISGNAWAQCVAYSFPNASDPREKKDIALSSAGALAKVLAVPVRNFHWLNEDTTAPLHIGWLATDVQSEFGPDSATVITGTDEAKTLSLNTMEMIAWLWQAVQELAAQVKALQPA